MNSKNTENHARIGYIDIAKCVAIVSVVTGHVLLKILYNFSDAWNSTLMTLVASYEMPLFFFLSGMVSLTILPKNGLAGDLWKRFRQLIVPFFTVATIYSLWKGLPYDYIFDTYKGGYWYLWVLFMYYIFSYFIFVGGEKLVELCGTFCLLVRFNICNY